jgi:ribosomal protein S12 methylthiotransferase accessory factor
LIGATGGSARPVDTALPIAHRLAVDLGVTRLADVTGLDRIGLPVWQAVRPWGRSLSVHQGKGLDAAAAQLGACMEAIECSHAEAWSPPLQRSACNELPAGERAPAADDFARRRGAVADNLVLDWAVADRLDGKGRLWVPAATVSLDLVTPGPKGITRSSNGQGAGFDSDFATLKALCEVIERDAFTAWQQGSVFTRGDDEVDLDAITWPWFCTLRARLTGLGIGMRAYHLPAVIAMPVVAVELHDRSGEAAGVPHAAGTSAHPDVEAALRSALTEAIQSRLTIIAGARDDLPLGLPEAKPPRFGFAIAPPVPVAHRPLHQPGPVLSLAAAVAALADAGYPQAARVVLSPPQSPVITVKVLVPGLGESRRLRRLPA